MGRTDKVIYPFEVVGLGTTTQVPQDAPVPDMSTEGPPKVETAFADTSSQESVSAPIVVSGGLFHPHQHP